MSVDSVGDDAVKDVVPAELRRGLAEEGRSLACIHDMLKAQLKYHTQVIKLVVRTVLFKHCKSGRRSHEAGEVSQ